jgi:hypothetical protein
MAVDFSSVSVWCSRVRYVKRLLAGAGGLGDRKGYSSWYDGREEYWAGLTRLLDDAGLWAGRVDDEEAYARWGPGGQALVEGGLGVSVAAKVGGRPKAVEGEPWVTEGISRRTWERRRKGGAT